MTSTGRSGTAQASPCLDSLRIPLAADDIPVTSLTLRLRATGAGKVHSPSPLHLLAYAPEFGVEGGSEVTGRSGAKFYLFTEGSDSEIRLVVDNSLRPHRAPPAADECDMSAIESMYEGGDFSFEGEATGGTITANRPGVYTLPDISLGDSLPVSLRSPRLSRLRGGPGGGRTIVVIDPSVGWNCYGHGCAYDGWIISAKFVGALRHAW